MNDIKKAVNEYLNKNPNTSIQVAKAHAQIIKDEEEYVQSFLRTWWDLKIKRQEFANGVNRIWPED